MKQNRYFLLMIGESGGFPLWASMTEVESKYNSSKTVTAYGCTYSKEQAAHFPTEAKARKAIRAGDYNNPTIFEVVETMTEIV